MNCPYCNRAINAMTGFQEATKFAAHLNRCPKRPQPVAVDVDKEGRSYVRPFNLNDALEIRAKSGQ